MLTETMLNYLDVVALEMRNLEWTAWR